METRRLEDMSLEELHRLFPVSLVPSNEEWAGWYESEAKAVLSVIPRESVRRCSHIGSTAIPGIRSKNIVDMLLEVREERDLRRAKDMLLSCGSGWRCMSENDRRIAMNKGYTEAGYAERVFHLHIRLPGDNDELYFRDYLREHADAARAYENLKLSLLKTYAFDRDGYTAAKADFVNPCTAIAKEKYRGRYE